jgi:hypothetical protein
MEVILPTDSIEFCATMSDLFSAQKTWNRYVRRFLPICYFGKPAEGQQGVMNWSIAEQRNGLARNRPNLTVHLETRRERKKKLTLNELSLGIKRKVMGKMEKRAWNEVTSKAGEKHTELFSRDSEDRDSRVAVEITNWGKLSKRTSKVRITEWKQLNLWNYDQ